MTDNTKPNMSMARPQLMAFLGRIESLTEERDAIGDQIKEVYAEAKSGGFDVKTLKAVVAIRKLPAQAAAEMRALLNLYMNAILGPDADG